MLPFCSGRVPILVHPLFYRFLKLRYPMDVGGITRDDRVSTELGTGSLHQAVGILQSKPGRHAWLPSLRQWFGRNGWARLLPLRASSPVLGSRRGVDGLHRTQTARAARRWLRRRQRSSSVSGWEACDVSRDPSCSSNGDLVAAKQGIVWRCKLFSSLSGFVL